MVYATVIYNYHKDIVDYIECYIDKDLAKVDAICELKNNNHIDDGTIGIVIDMDTETVVNIFELYDHEYAYIGDNTDRYRYTSPSELKHIIMKVQNYIEQDTKRMLSEMFRIAIEEEDDIKREQAQNALIDLFKTIGNDIRNSSDKVTKERS